MFNNSPPKIVDGAFGAISGKGETLLHLAYKKLLPHQFPEVVNFQKFSFGRHLLNLVQLLKKMGRLTKTMVCVLH